MSRFRHPLLPCPHNVYLNYLQISLIVAFVLGLGIAFGYVLGLDRNALHKKTREVFANLDSEVLHWALGDPQDALAALSDFPVKIDDKHKGDAHTILYLIHGTLFRQSGSAQKAYRIHQSLLAKPHLEKNLQGVIEFQCCLDLFEQKRFAEAEDLLKKLPRGWKGLASIRSFRDRLHRAKSELKNDSGSMPT